VAEHWQIANSDYPGELEGCCYIVDDADDRRRCGAEPRPGSSYCPQHHALCHVAGGTRAEARRLREVEALASAVGGRRGNSGTGPSRRFLKKLEQAIRVLS
jgi:hypothetical protein